MLFRFLHICSLHICSLLDRSLHFSSLHLSFYACVYPALLSPTCLFLTHLFSTFLFLTYVFTFHCLDLCSVVPAFFGFPYMRSQHICSLHIHSLHSVPRIFVPRTFVPLIFVPRISVHVTIPAYSFLVHLFPDICSRNIFLLRIRLLHICSPHIRTLYICSPIFVPVIFSPAYSSLANCSPHTRTLHICSPYISSLQSVPRIGCTLFTAIPFLHFIPCTFFPGAFSSTKCTELELFKIQ